MPTSLCVMPVSLCVTIHICSVPVGLTGTGGLEVTLFEIGLDSQAQARVLDWLPVCNDR